MGMNPDENRPVTPPSSGRSAKAEMTDYTIALKAVSQGHEEGTTFSFARYDEVPAAGHRK